MFLTGIIFITIVSCFDTRLFPRDANDLAEFQKQKAFPKSNLPGISSKNNSTLPSRNKLTRAPNITSSQTRQPIKWQVERVTKKQYGIINMLWRKTKIFVNVENTTPEQMQDNMTIKTIDPIQRRVSYIFSSQPPILQSFKPSFIEFYYSDENESQRDCVNTKCQPKINGKSNNVKNPLDSSFVVFHIKGPLLKKTMEKKTSLPSPNFSLTTVMLNESTNKPTISTENPIFETNTELKSSAPSSYNGITNEPKYTNFKTRLKYTNSISDFTVNTNQTEPTTVYDKIKFFELYDKHTRLPITKKAKMLEYQYNENTHENYDVNNFHQILLQHVDQSTHEHNQAKHSKKHIVQSDKNPSDPFFTSSKGIKPKAHISNVTIARQNSTDSYVNNKNFEDSELKENKNVYSYVNKSVEWSEYPFAAVYIYEPSQLHCDAASISAHWLVASGSCLSRLNQKPVFGEGRSAFVAYCGERWWQPERVSYVKYSLVHPRYNPTDMTRKHLYNIGVIQVVTSMMSACNEWAPLSLMSHQFAANRGGSEAIALGWGLDRYDTRYTAMDLPRTSLMIYKGLLFSDSCPGNIGYGKLKRFDNTAVVKNVYCLSLPPYSGEERDPIHGSLLLVNGKLIALYLQEERHPWGEQSAEYTGIWRLIPWVMEVAKEPEEMEPFTV